MQRCGTWYWLLVMQQVPQVDQQGRHKVRHSVGEGCYKGTQPQHSPMPHSELLPGVGAGLLTAVLGQGALEL